MKNYTCNFLRWLPCCCRARAHSGATAKDAEGLEEVAGPYVARAFFSKNWQLRDAAMTHMANDMRGGAYEGRHDAFRTLVRAIQVGVCVGGCIVQVGGGALCW